jgi:hypothetical protein
LDTVSPDERGEVVQILMEAPPDSLKGTNQLAQKMILAIAQGRISPIAADMILKYMDRMLAALALEMRQAGAESHYPRAAKAQVFEVAAKIKLPNPSYTQDQPQLVGPSPLDVIEAAPDPLELVDHANLGE